MNRFLRLMSFCLLWQEIYAEPCHFWPVFNSVTRTASLPFGNTITFNHSNPLTFRGLYPYSFMGPGNPLSPDPTVPTTSPPNPTPHLISDLGVFSIYPATTGDEGTISFSVTTTTAFYLHVGQTLSRIDFDQPFTLISSDGDLVIGNSNGLVSNVLIPTGAPGDSPDDANATIFFAAGMNQVGYRVSADYYGDGFAFAFTFPDTCMCITPIMTINATICEGQDYSGYVNSGIYIDTLFAANGCDSLKIINLISIPKSYCSLTQTICDGQSYLGYTKSGTYIDTLINVNGCDSIRTLDLTLLSKPAPDLGADKNLCPGDSLILYPGQFNSYLWQDGSVKNSQPVKQPGLYSVFVTNNCGSARDNILVKEGICDVYFPNAFTPNNDGKNDIFRGLGKPNLSDYHLSVYDRWGFKIFETSEYSLGWDGKLNGRSQSTGVFVWYCEFRNPGSPVKKIMKGTVALIR